MGWLRVGWLAVGAVMLNVGCDASVDICGDDSVPVCGADMVLYGDYCAAGAAGVEVIAEGACPCEPVTCEIACEFGFAIGANGCEECRCADGPGDDAGVDAGGMDAGTLDAGVPDTGAGEDASVVSPDSGMIVCPEGQLLCDGTCTPQGVENCGACDRSCGGEHGEAACVDGRCVYECEPGYLDCSPDVAGCDTLASPSRCGCDADIACSPPFVGTGEATCEYDDRTGEYGCGIACEGDLQECEEGGCYDTFLDEDHCGACGNPCGELAACNRGTCSGPAFCNNPENWELSEDGSTCRWTCGRFSYHAPFGAGRPATCTAPDGSMTSCTAGDSDCAPNVGCCSPTALARPGG